MTPDASWQGPNLAAKGPKAGPSPRGVFTAWTARDSWNSGKDGAFWALEKRPARCTRMEKNGKGMGGLAKKYWELIGVCGQHVKPWPVHD